MMQQQANPQTPPQTQMPTIPQNMIVQPTAQITNEEEVAQARRRRFKIIAGVILGAIMLYLLYRSMKRNREEKQSASDEGADSGGPLSRLLGGILGFDRSGNSSLTRDSGAGASAGGVVPRQAGSPNQMPDFGLEKESEQTLAELAAGLKKEGFTLQGVSHCKWTKIQRDMFGDRESPARKLLESMYIECRGEEMCPGLRGYPTWVRGDRKFSGFQPPNKLRMILKEMEKIDPTPMLQGPSEPIHENIPDAKHIADIPTQISPESAKDMMYQQLKDMRAGESGGEVAAVEADRTGAGATIDTKGSIGVGATQKPMGTGEAVEEDSEEMQGGPANEKNSGCKDGVKKELARGVSAYAPLNVPDMPGTAPMNLDLQHPDFQNYQGNVPRAAFSNHEPVAELARQVVRAYDNLSEHARRDPMAASFSQTRLPHSSDITTGDALADKRLPIDQNQ